MSSSVSITLTQPGSCLSLEEGRLCLRTPYAPTLRSAPVSLPEVAQCLLGISAQLDLAPELRHLAQLTGWSITQVDETTLQIGSLLVDLEDLILSWMVVYAREHESTLTGYLDGQCLLTTLQDATALHSRSGTVEREGLADILALSEPGEILCRLTGADTVWEEGGYLVHYQDPHSYYWCSGSAVERWLARLCRELAATE